MTLYLLDANVLIRAHGDYYPIDRIPQFWAWLRAQAEAGTIKMPTRIFDEVCGSADQLGTWLKRADVKRALVLDEPTDMAAVQRVIAVGYASDLTDVEIVTLGQDPFLIAACVSQPGRVVVTREVSRPSAQRANRKVPDVRRALGLASMTDFELWRVLAFKIG
jgi:hypothetical protein